MLKRVFTLFILVAILGVATNASERTDAEMRTVAARYLLSNASRGTAAQKLNAVVTDPQLAVYAVEGNGFVVVSRDDQFPAVLGVSDSEFDTDNLAPGFSWWLKEVGLSMQRRLDANDWYVKATPSAVVESFITTRWDQGAPYNLKCPKIATSNCPTGCVATAAAQVMKYYNYPAQSQGSVSYTKNSMPKNGTLNSVYDWANMMDAYTSRQTTLTPTTEAVATLMFDAGAASSMSYTGNYGSANMMNCAYGMTYNFKYDSLSLRCLPRALYTDLEWTDMVYNELAKKQPVLYSGTPLDGSAGHAFVLDGVDAEGKVHVNWGWSGRCDGYYNLFLLQPGDEAAQHGDYSNYNQMIIGFNPTETPAEGIEEKSLWLSDSTYWFSIDKTDSLMLTARGIYNYNYRSFYGQLFVRMENVNGNDEDSWDIYLYDTEDDEDEDATPIQPQYGFVFNIDDRNEVGSVAFFDLKDDRVKPGTYIVSLVTKAKHEIHPSPVRCVGGRIFRSKLTKTADGKLFIEDYTPTGISHISTSKPVDDKNTYDMNGRPVSSVKKGVYIQNGRKVVIK